MLRDQLLSKQGNAHAAAQEDSAFRWRDAHVTRLEGFTDAVLGFAIYAWRRRDELDLNVLDRLDTMTSVRGHAVNVAVGCLSIAIAFLGGAGAAAWAGWTYLLLFPLLAASETFANHRRRRKTPPAPNWPLFPEEGVFPEACHETPRPVDPHQYGRHARILWPG